MDELADIAGTTIEERIPLKQGLKLGKSLGSGVVEIY